MIHFHLKFFIDFSFVNNRGLGYMTHFSGPMLVVEILGKNGKKQTILVKSKFEPLMVCIYYLIVFNTLIVSLFILLEKKNTVCPPYTI